MNGVRHKLANFNHIISIKAWQTLQVVARGNRFKIFFNEQPVIDISDETFQAGGKIGLWTKADALTYFDDLQLSIAGLIMNNRRTPVTGVIGPVNPL